MAGSLAAHGKDGDAITQAWVNFGLGLTLYIAYSILWFQHKKLTSIIDDEQITPSDFTLLLS
jgi:hypothetical protein